MNVYIATDPFDKDTYKLYKTENIIELLKSQFDKFPIYAKIYHNSVSVDNDVTPKTEEDVNRLMSLDGDFFVLLYPGDPITVVIAIVAIVATAAVAFLLAPKVPTNVSTDIQSETGSSNNQLGARQNKPSLNGRIPDIYGQVRSVPDLIALPYTFFDSAASEYELSYMCVGRGYYDISDVREGYSPHNSSIGGYAFYEPGNSPISGVPYLIGGQFISETIYNYNRLADLNGDTIPAPGSGSLVLGYPGTSTSYKTVGFTYKRLINLATGTTIDTNNLIVTYPVQSNTDPNDLIKIGDTVTVTSNLTGFNGTYTVASIGQTQVRSFVVGTGFVRVLGWIVELSPYAGTFNNGFVLVSGQYCYDMSTTQSMTISLANSGLLGPFIINDETATTALINFIAPSGIYGGSNISIKTIVTPLPTGTSVETTFILTPKTNFNGFKGYSFNLNLPGKCTVSFERLTAKLTVDTDEIKIRDFYYGKPLTGSYSDVTTVLVLSKQTQTQTSTPERNFNCLAYRKIPTRISGTTFTTALTATNNAADIIAAVCLDQYIGRRSISELDLDSIYNTIAEVYTYFGPSGSINDVKMFNYTFDKTGISFEETVAMIAIAIHCTAYRQGNKIKLKFEKENAISSLMFNHRNVIPNSMQRAVSFGIINDYDGVKFKYIDPSTDKETIMYVPNSSVINPKDVEIVGVRSKIQAYYLAWRAWNKLKNQNIALKFEAMQESDLLIISDKILVSDLTRNDIYEGEIINQVGLTLGLSIDVNVSNGDTIFLQYKDGTIGSKTIISNPTTNTITIDSAPSLELVTDIDSYARTAFIIQKAGTNVTLPFIVNDKNPLEKFTNELSVINYSDLYYTNDHDNPALI